MSLITCFKTDWYCLYIMGYICLCFTKQYAGLSSETHTKDCIFKYAWTGHKGESGIETFFRMFRKSNLVPDTVATFYSKTQLCRKNFTFDEKRNVLI
jgi:hypothetical protein